MITIFNGRTRTLKESGTSSFIQIEHRILKHMGKFTSSEWMVFCALALHADQDGASFPSIPKLVSITGLSAPTIRNAMAGLESKEIDGYKVIGRSPRFVDKRQTSNQYVIFPGYQGESILEGEGKDSYRGEGKEISTPINKNQLEQESIKVKGRKTITLPKDNDPARELYVAFRAWKYPELNPTEFNLTEWKSVYYIFYEMTSKGITPDKVTKACARLLQGWNDKNMITPRSLWKHWSTATTEAPSVSKPSNQRPTSIDHATSAMEIMRSVNNFLDNTV